MAPSFFWGEFLHCDDKKNLDNSFLVLKCKMEKKKLLKKFANGGKKKTLIVGWCTS
jgi:hypothetical protein